MPTRILGEGSVKLLHWKEFFSHDSNWKSNARQMFPNRELFPPFPANCCLLYTAAPFAQHSAQNARFCCRLLGFSGCDAERDHKPLLYFPAIENRIAGRQTLLLSCNYETVCYTTVKAI